MFEVRARGMSSGLMVACAALAIGTALVAATPDVGVDRSVRPGDDFYRFANNNWLRAARIPEGASSVDSSTMLRALNAGRVRALVDDAVRAAARGGAVPADTRKIADYYTAQLDGAGVETKGLAPISHDLAAIAAIGDRGALARYLGGTLRLDDGTNQQTESLWGLWVHQGFHDADHNAAHIVQGGLGLGDTADYLDAAPEHAAHRMLYQAHVAALLRLAGLDQPETRAARVVALETAIARTHASRADTDDVFKTDNDWRQEDFAARAPGIDWTAYFAAAGLGTTTRFVVWQPGAVIGGARLVSSEALDAWRDYLTFHLVAHYTAVLPHAVGDTLAGATPSSAPDRAPQALAATEAVLGDAIGRLYVARYFPPGSKAAVTAMVANIRTAWRAHLAGLGWMTPATKQKAQAKLAAMRIGLGYPEHGADYAALAVVPGDAFGNFRRAERFAYARAVAKLSRPVDLDEWPAGLYPHMVGAILDISPNTIEFAAGLFQPPFFAPGGDAAANYGSAGAGLAHEIGHGFDELGNVYDARGRLGLWWTATDTARYRAATAPFVAQLDACCPTAEACSHGKQVLGESALDLAGLVVAHDAYRLSLHGRPDVVKNGLTGDQRFFLAFAQRWRKSQTEVAARRQIATDTHAPPPCRGNLVRNVAAWTHAFGVRTGDRLYLKPEERVLVW